MPVNSPALDGTAEFRTDEKKRTLSLRCAAAVRFLSGGAELHSAACSWAYGECGLRARRQ